MHGVNATNGVGTGFSPSVPGGSMRIAVAAFLFLLMPGGLAAQPNDNISTIAGRAAAAYEAAHYDEAATLYRDVLRLAPRSVGARLELARSLARAGKSEEALDYLRQVSEFGVSFDPADVAWSSLRSTQRFRATESLERFVEVPGAFFNGIAITPDGRTLFAASYVDGVMKIDIATKKSRLLDLPKAVTLGGIDGLYYRDRSLIAVQNGIDPIRVIRASLDPKLRRVTRFEVLEQGHPLSDIPLTGVIAGNDLYYIARSQLRAFRDGKILPADQLQDTVILKLPLR
jgi:pentatricopeptide repeat protein